MKIAMCGRFNTEKKHQGGSAVAFLDLARYLSKENTITLFGRGKPTKEIADMCKNKGIDYYFIPSDSYLNILLSPIRAIILLARKFNDFDIIHTHTGSFAFASVFFKKKCKIITHIHEVPVFSENSFLINIYLFLESRLLKFAAKNSDHVLTGSHYMTKEIKDKWQIRNVTCIRYGIDTEIFTYKSNVKVIKLFKDCKHKLLFVGRLTKRKGILELIDSVRYLQKDNIRLLIIGNGELLSQVKKKLSKLNGKVQLIEYLKKHEQLASYYSSSDLVITPSHYEPAGLVPLEALACGSQVLVSDNTGLKELDHCFKLTKIEPEAIAIAIKKIFSEKKRFKKNREYVVENYGWGKIIDEYKKIYTFK
jgi:glycosyltransferase involved in cell wall biosynthesis